MQISKRRNRAFSSARSAALLLCALGWLCLGTLDAANGAAGDPESRAVFLWKNPGNISTRDLYWGPGGQAGAPRAPFQFLEEDMGGTQPKIEVTDAEGMRWSVKFGEEAHAEVAASRLVWAFGYLVEETYFVPSGKIEGVKRLKRSKPFVGPDGAFKEARFEKRPKNVKREGIWEWNGNPFTGTKEFTGLKIVMAMNNAWDTKPVNNRILKVTTESGAVEYWYVTSDLGDAFGRMGMFPQKRTTWEIGEFQKQEFIEKVSDDKLTLHYSGHAPIMEVPLEHARWFASVARNLTEAQVRRAFEASGATPEEVSAFSIRIMEKIRQLLEAVGPESRRGN